MINFTPSLLLLCLFSFLLLIQGIRRYLRLRHVPGPFICNFTSAWRWNIMNRPAYGEKMVALHRAYGPLIRLGPNRVSTCDPAMVREIFGTNPVWEKAPSYQGAAPYFKGRALPSVVSMSEAQSTAIHRVAGAAFTANALLDYEDYIDESCADLLARLLETKGEKTDIGRWFMCFAFNVIGLVAFSDSLGFLQRGDDVEDLMAATKDRFDHWGRWGAVPDLERLLFKSPLARVWLPSKPSPLAAAAQKKLAQRYDPSFSLEKGRQDLLGKFLDGAANHPGMVTDKEILGMVQSAIGAGADTTGASLTIIFIYLARHPDVVRKLREELEGAELSNPPTWDQCRKLPYLHAVISECLRILPVSQWGHDRVVPPGGTTVAGHFVPEGTVVGVLIDSVHRNESVFGAEPDYFRPERWIIASPEQRLRMEASMLGFGSGKRLCLGRHIAWLEMKKLIPVMLLHLDVEILDPNIDLTQLEASSVRYLPPIIAKIRERPPRKGVKST